MSYIVIKNVKGRKYRYRQRTYREGGRVKTESIYLGPVDGTPSPGVLNRLNDFLHANFEGTQGVPDHDTMLRQFNAAVERENQARDKKLAELHEQFGLKLGDTPPVPVGGASDEVAPAPPDGAADQATDGEGS
jgi:hypothetical protein